MLGKAKIHVMGRGSTVEGRFEPSDLLHGTLATLPLELPMYLIATCRKLSETLNAGSPDA